MAFYSAEHYIHEARMCNGDIQALYINTGESIDTIKGRDIFLGFGFLKNLESSVVERIVIERRLNGKFTSLGEFIDRVAISVEQLAILIRIGVFRFTELPKVELLWPTIFKIKANKTRTINPMFFKMDQVEVKIPTLEFSWIEDAYDQMELLGFPLYDYFDLADEELKSVLRAKDMANHINKPILLYGIMVNTRFNRTKHGKNMRLSTFVDLDGHYFGAVHFPML